MLNYSPKRFFLLCLLLTISFVQLSAEVFFTERAQENPVGMERVLRSWAAQAQAFPDGHMARWLLKPGEPGYMGDITVDFDNDRLQRSNALALWSDRTLILPNALSAEMAAIQGVSAGADTFGIPEPYLSGILAHESGHAYLDTKVPHIDWVLPPRYAVGMNMIREIAAFLPQAKEEARHNSRYTITEVFTELPQLVNGESYETLGNIITYFYRLRKYYTDTNPGWDEAMVQQATSNQFAMGFLSNDVYMHNSLNALNSQFYALLIASGGGRHPPPVLARYNTRNVANLDLIMRTYLQAAMPDGVALTLDVEDFMRELSRNIDRIDAGRTQYSTCAHMDATLERSIRRIRELGDDMMVEPQQILSHETANWLNELVSHGRMPPPELRPEEILLANSLYSHLMVLEEEEPARRDGFFRRLLNRLRIRPR